MHHAGMQAVQGDGRCPGAGAGTPTLTAPPPHPPTHPPTHPPNPTPPCMQRRRPRRAGRVQRRRPASKREFRAFADSVVSPSADRGILCHSILPYGSLPYTRFASTVHGCFGPTVVRKTIKLHEIRGRRTQSSWHSTGPSFLKSQPNRAARTALDSPS